jgi:hypothetical protein
MLLSKLIPYWITCASNKTTKIAENYNYAHMSHSSPFPKDR